MNRSTKPVLYLVLALACVLAAPPAATAQEPCECNCYFSTDCVSNEFCDWGESFTIQDSCWWRRPKPRGVPGRGCTGDYGDWGECDGTCEPRLAAGSRMFGGESRDAVRRGAAMWAKALTETSLKGGGVPAARWAERIGSIGFNDPAVGYRLWRVMAEVLMLGRGADYLVFPEADGGAIFDIAVADLRGDPARARNGNLAVAAVLAEMDDTGAGAPFIYGEIDAARLDRELLARICPDGENLDCLYERLVTLAVALGQAGGGAAAGDVTPPCAGCVGDVDFNDDVEFGDLLMVLADFGETDSPADVNLDGIVNFADLLTLLAAWGPCRT